MKCLLTSMALAVCITAPGLAQHSSFSGVAGSRTYDTDGSVSMDGAAVTARGRIGENLVMNGASVDVYADIGGDVELNGASIEMNGSAGGHVEANGATVRLEGHYAGPVTLAGATLTLDGTFQGPIEADGGDLRLKGRFLESVSFMGRDRNGWFRRGNQSHVRINAELNKGGLICAREVSFSEDSRLGDILIIIAEDRPDIPEGIDENLIDFQERNNRSCES